MQRFLILFTTVILFTKISIVFAQDDALKYADALTHQAIRLYNQGKYSESIPIALKVLEIREKILGSEHPVVAESLNNLGVFYTDSGGDGEYPIAESYFKRSLVIVEKTLGPEHLLAATIKNGLALLYLQAGHYSKAEQFSKQSLALYVKNQGQDHLDVANSLNTLASIYRVVGEYSRAELLFNQSLAIYEKVKGLEHPQVVKTIINLAFVYQALGNYSKAEALCERSLGIMEKALGSEHPHVAGSLNCLGGIYEYLGDYSKAESFYKRSLAINEKAFGPEHLYVAGTMYSLGNVYMFWGKYFKAEPLLKRALAIREKKLGLYHKDVADILNSLGLLYMDTGKFYKAISFLNQSLALSENIIGRETTGVATILNNLALCYQALGYHFKAESFLERSLAIEEKTFGSEHPNVAIALNNLALGYVKTDKFAKANEFFKNAQAIDEAIIEQVMSFTSENQKLNFLSLNKASMYHFINFVNQYKTNLSSSAQRDVLDVWLKRKGIVLEVQKRFQDAVKYSEDSGAEKTFQVLAQKRTRLSKLTFSDPGKEDFERYKTKISKLKKDIWKLEAKLSRISQTFALKLKKSKADSVQVGKLLPEKTVLIEFARIETYNFKEKVIGKKWGKDIYLAFVLHSGKGDTPEFIDLGDAEKIDNMISSLKKKIVNRLETGSEKISYELYNLVFAPLKNSLGDAKEIFISPDGNLNLIPFEILKDRNGKYLIESYSFNYLSAGRDLLDFGQIKSKEKKAVLIGDPDFDMNSIEKKKALRRLGINLSASKYAATRSAEMRGLQFARLPGTKKEVETIHALMGDERSALYTGKDALEDVLKFHSAPWILHLATHGFFLSDSQMERLIQDAGDLYIKKSIHQVKYKNPLLRSGIALAGANNALHSNDVNESDGIVTAEKILGLRLHGTGMVVLSACETGLGEVKSGEGVYGLRRAFTQAGAKSLVMSMWSVPDKETQQLMTEFYKNIIIKKMNRAQALRKAELTQMEITKARYGENNPFYWGAFIFLGEP